MSASAVVALPIVVAAQFRTDELTLVALIAVLSGLLVKFLFGAARILTSVYCYAVDTAEHA